MYTYRFLSNSELPDNILEILNTKSGTLAYSEILHTYKEMDYAESVNLSLYTEESPAAILLEVNYNRENTENALEFGDAVLFPKDTVLNINSIDEIQLPDRRILRFSVNPQTASQSANPSNTPPQTTPQTQPKPAKPVLEKDDYSKGLTERNRQAARRESMQASAMAESGHLLHGDPLLHDLDTIPEDVAKEGIKLKPKHPDKYTFYKVDLFDDPQTGKLTGKWGYHNPWDLLYIPGRDSKQRDLHTLRTHKDVGQVVPEWVMTRIRAGVGGQLETTAKAKHAYVNMKNNERDLGYAWFSKIDAPHMNEPFPHAKALEFYTKLYTIKAIPSLGKSKKVLKKGLPDNIREEIRRKALEKMFDSAGYDNYKEMAAHNAKGYLSTIDPVIDSVFASGKGKGLRQLLPSQDALNEKRGKWDTFANDFNADKKLVREENTSRRLIRKVMYDHATGKIGGGEKKQLIEHILDHITKVADKVNNDRYRATLDQLQAVEIQLKQLGQDPNVLTTKRHHLDYLINQFRQLKNKANLQKRIRDSQNIIYLMAVVNGLRAQNETVAEEKKEEAEEQKEGQIKQGAATLTSNNVSFGDDEGKPHKTYIHFLSTKSGGRGRFVNYDPYINRLLRRAIYETRSRKEHLDKLGDILPEYVRNQLIKDDIASNKFDPKFAAGNVNGDFAYTPEELKDVRLFAHNPDDFYRAVYGGWGNGNDDRYSHLFPILSQAGFEKPQGKDSEKINAQLLRKFNVNVRASNEAQIFGANLFLGTNGKKDLYLMPKKLAKIEEKIRARVAQATGHTPHSAQSYIFPNTIERSVILGYRRARQYFKKNGKRLTAKEYRDIFLR